MSGNLRVACWRSTDESDILRVAAARRLAQLFPGGVTLVMAGVPVAQKTRAAAQEASLELECVDGGSPPSEVDLVLALGPEEPGLSLDAPAVLLLPPGAEAPAGTLGLVATRDAEEIGDALAFLALDPDLRRGLRRERLGPRLPEGCWRIEGPFDSSFSLAIVNRELALAFDHQGVAAALDGAIYRAGRPANAELFAAHPEVAALYERRHAHAAVTLGNDYPPAAAALPRAPLMLLANYAWEESGYPAGWAREFNWRLDALTVCSPLVKKILRDAGVRRPIAVVGNGTDHLARVEPRAPEGLFLGGAGRFRFLHISSGLPRKGVDVLLEAYGQAFTAADPVTLVLKTIPDAANVAPQLLARLREKRSDFPEVILIDADLPAQAVAWLYKQCDAFVLVTRAEGFGLPIAEAALYGLPTIAAAFGGQRCLVDEESGFLVPGRFARSRSHLGIADSLWFEPDVAALAATLRRVAALPKAALRQRAQRAQKRLAALYRWEDVARRTREAVRVVWSRPMLAREGKIGWLSTWRTRCGLATYSQHLTAEWPAERLVVLARNDAEPDGRAIRVPKLIPCWSQGRLDVAEVRERLLAAGCEALVVQHHPGLFSFETLGRLAALLAQDGIRTYATLHNTAALDAKGAEALRTVHRLLVHTVADMNRLLERGLAERATFFPHGIYPPPQGTEDLLARLGLAGRRIVASFGFLMPHKGLIELLEGFARLAPRHPELHLLMLNAVYPSAASGAEAERLRERIEALGLGRQVTLVTDFLPDAEVLELLASAELAVFAYQYTDESASGAVRMAIAAGCPVLVTPLPIFEDVAEVVHFLPGREPEAIAKGLDAALAQLAEPATRAQARERIHEFAAPRRWPILGKRLLDMIDGDLDDPFPEGLLE